MKQADLQSQVGILPSNDTICKQGTICQQDQVMDECNTTSMQLSPSRQNIKRKRQHNTDVGTKSKTTSTHSTENVQISSDIPSRQPASTDSAPSHKVIATQSVHISNSVPTGGPVLANTTVPQKATGFRTKQWNFGPPTHKCIYCGAILWYEERANKSKNYSQPKFSFCCMQGRVQLPLLKEPPPLLKYLQSPESGQKGNKFMAKIRIYNSVFAIASTGGRIPTSINKSKGPPVYRISGTSHHNIGSLLPADGQKPKFAQLYIYDTDNEIDNRINRIKRNGKKSDIDHEVVIQLSEMLERHNILV